MSRARKFYFWCISACCLFMLASCGSNHKEYKIGMSQCGRGEWREQMNHEVQREVLLHDDISLDLRVSNEDSEKQCRDIDSLIDIGVDALIVSPANPKKLKASIEKAYDAGIPVILVDRDVETEKYTAFVGGDNMEVGRLAAQCVASIYNKREGTKPRIIEIQGDTAITPAKDRHFGFRQEMSRYNIDFQTSYSHWLDTEAAHIADSLLNGSEPESSFIFFTHNDRMATGIVNELKHLNTNRVVDIVSVDGSPLLGMNLVVDGSIKATIKYPTGGSEAIRTAIDILQNRDFERKQLIAPIIIDSFNAKTLREQELRAISLTNDLLLLGDNMADYAKRDNWQTLSLFILCSLLAIAVVSLVLLARKIKVNKALQHELTDTITAVSDDTQHSPFAIKLREIITDNVANQNFSVDDIATQLNMGRSAFYRKTKEVTGYTPNDILRTIRLQQAATLLKNSDLNISDISQQCGFNNPSYFTRTFRDYYQMTPKDYREECKAKTEEA